MECDCLQWERPLSLSLACSAWSEPPPPPSPHALPPPFPPPPPSLQCMGATASSLEASHAFARPPPLSPPADLKKAQKNEGGCMQQNQAACILLKKDIAHPCNDHKE